MPAMLATGSAITSTSAYDDRPSRRASLSAGPNARVAHENVVPQSGSAWFRYL